LTTLKPHPRQAEFFDDLSDAELKALAEDIRQRGLRERIEILPDGTIISGHQRLRALKLLGYHEFEVIVRNDLAGADANVIDQAFLAANFHRRQLDRLAKAKVALGLIEAEQGREVNNHNWHEINDARDRVGALIGMSGRNLQRYWSVLRTPTEVQNAFRAKKIKLVLAASVATLQQKYKDRVAERIRNGEDPKSVITEVVGPSDRRRSPKSTIAVFRAGMKHLGLFLEVIEGRVDKIRGSSYLESMPTLSRARKVLRQIVEQLKNADADDQEFAKRRKASTEELAKIFESHGTGRKAG